jgi:hypothetical protein
MYRSCIGHAKQPVNYVLYGAYANNVWKIRPVIIDDRTIALLAGVYQI